MWNSRLHWLPLLTVAFFIINFITIYALAVSNGHVEAFWPYISSAGGTPPESCIFALFLFISSVLTGSCVYARFRYIEAHLSPDALMSRAQNTNFSILGDSGALTAGVGEHVGQGCCSVKSLRATTYVAAALGLIAAFGLAIVGSFQEGVLLSVHLTGALLSFAGGLVYCAMDAVLTIILKNRSLCRHTSNSICCLRVLFVILIAGFLMSTNVAGVLCSMRRHASNHTVYEASRPSANTNFVLTSNVTELDPANSMGLGEEETESNEPSILHLLFWYKYYVNEYAKSRREGAYLSEQPDNDEAILIAYLVSTISEWLMAISLFSYYLTLVFEMRMFALASPDAILLVHSPETTLDSHSMDDRSSLLRNAASSDYYLNQRRAEVRFAGRFVHDNICRCSVCRTLVSSADRPATITSSRYFSS